MAATRLRLDRFVIDLDAHTVVDDQGGEIRLTRSEFAILGEFVHLPGRVLSRDHLLHVTAGRHATPFDRSIDVLVGRLRRKIESRPDTPRLIVTVPGVGYRLAAKPEVESAPADTDRTPPVAALDTPIATERRGLTVLLAGLQPRHVTDGMDPEDLLGLVANFHALCHAAVVRFGGNVKRSDSAGLEAWFGFPTALEHAAERAVRAALAIQADARTSRQRPPAGSEPSVAIATGEVVFSAWPGRRAEPMALGEPLNEAVRLIGLCRPGAVVIDDNVQNRVGRLFDLKPLGGVDAFEVLGETQVASRFEALHRAPMTPFVGREEELSLLLRRWQRARSGEGRMVHVAGEAGIGKSRLIHEFVLRLDDPQTSHLAFDCAPLQTDSPLYPFIRELEHAAGLSGSDTPEARQAKLAALIPEPDRLSLLGRLIAVRDLAEEHPDHASPHLIRAKTIDAIAAHVVGHSRAAPTLITFEDIHWIDPTSLEVLGNLAMQLRHYPILLITSARPDFEANWPSSVGAENLTLARLEDAEIADLIIAANGSKLTRVLRQRVIERSDGVPLFVEELTASLLERGATAEVAMPASLHDLLMARLDRTPSALELARVCAAVGNTCPHALLARVAGQLEAEWQPALKALIASGLVIRRGEPPQATYVFKHALVQSAAYESVPKSRRSELHVRIAAGLCASETESGTIEPAMLALHYERAGLAELAVENWLKAGQQALSRSGLAEAEGLFRRALQVAAGIADDMARRERELEALVALARLLTAVRGLGVPGVGEIYARARELCDQVDRSDLLAPVLWGQWIYNTLRLDMDEGQLVVLDFERHAEQTDRAPLRVLSGRMRGLYHLILGEFPAASESLDAALAGHDPARRPIYATVTTQDTLVNALAMSSLALTCCGRLSEARVRRAASLREARRLSHPPTSALALWWVWQAAWCARSDPHELLRLADDLLRETREHGFVYWQGIALSARGWSLAAVGQPDEGRRLLSDGLTQLQGTGTRLFVPTILTLLADVTRITGDLEAALVSIEEAEQISTSSRYGLSRAETLRLRGDLHREGGALAAAEASFRAALELARRQGACLFELRVAVSLARLWRSQSRASDARSLLSPFQSAFESGEDNPDLAESRRLLQELADGNGPEPRDTSQGDRAGRSDGGSPAADRSLGASAL